MQTATLASPAQRMAPPGEPGIALAPHRSRSPTLMHASSGSSGHANGPDMYFWFTVERPFSSIPRCTGTSTFVSFLVRPTLLMSLLTAACVRMVSEHSLLRNHKVSIILLIPE